MDTEQVKKLAKAFLKQAAFFKGLDDPDLDILVANSQLREIPRGKLLYRKGEPSNETFCMLISGSVNIVAKDGHVVKNVGPGEIVGEIALSNPYKTRTLSVITNDPIEIMEWNINHIKGRIPDLWKKLLKLAWGRMQEYYED